MQAIFINFSALLLTFFALNEMMKSYDDMR